MFRSRFFGWIRPFPIHWVLYLLLSGITPAAQAVGWSVTAPMSDARMGYTATTLEDGRVLATGGFTEYANSLHASAELYDPDTGFWTATGAMNVARSSHTATLLGMGKVLVVGGLNQSGSNLTSAELYNPSTGTWATTTSTIVEHGQGHTATLLANGSPLTNGNVLVAGGSNATTTWSADVELYDPNVASWSRNPAGFMKTARYGHTATLLPNGKVLVTGGRGSSGVLASAELYDTTSGRWSYTGDMHTARIAHTATLLASGKVLVVGGVDNTAELYDPSTGAWTPTGSMLVPRGLHTATLLATGRVLVAGGSPSASAEIYDPLKGSWSAAESMDASIYGHTATPLTNGKVLIAGGTNYDSGAVLANARLYDPVHVTQIAIGNNTTCELIDSAVFCWLKDYSTGNYIYDPSIPLPSWGSGMAAIAVGGDHICALVSDGTVQCSGDNYAGQLGNGTFTGNISTPVTVTGLSDVIALAVGWSHTCAVTSGGTVRCWGYNRHGALGNGTTTDSPTPVAVTGISSVTSIASGMGDTCAVTSDGKAWCWGSNSNGALGNGTTTDSSTPVAVTGLSGVTSIAMGSDYACALTGGAVWCWGNNNESVLGNSTLGNGSAISTTPVPVTGISDATAMAMGSYSACAISGGLVKCWGDSFSLGDQLGSFIATGDIASYIPATVVDMGNATAIGVGDSHACVLTTDGTPQCWGDNFYGQLNLDANIERSFAPVTPGAVYNTVTVTGTAGSGGAVYPATQTIIRGAKTTLDASPNTGYALASITGCGGGSLVSGMPSYGGGHYVTGTVTENCMVNATFSPVPTATNVTASSAQLNGIVTASVKGDTPVDFRYGLTTDYSGYINADQSPILAGTVGAHVNAIVSNLACGTTYHYKTEASAPYGHGSVTVSSSDQTFTTSACPPAAPSVTTTAASDITTTGATLNGTVNDNRATTTVTIQYGLTNSYGTSVAAIPGTIDAGAGQKSVYANLAGLTCSTLYYYKVSAVNSIGTTTDSGKTFTTATCPPAAPTATTMAASNITTTTATLNATVNDHWGSTTVAFQLGLTSSSSITTLSATPATINAGAGNTTVSQARSALTCNTTYHYKVKATNSVTTTYGDDLTFTTLACATAPTATATQATAIGLTSATLNGTVNDNRAAVTAITFLSGPTDSYGVTSYSAPYSIAANSGDKSVSVTRSGLTCGTTYHYAVKAVNSVGTTTSSDASFQTLACLPTVATSPATSITYNGAVLNGQVSAGGANAAVTFDYGTSISYGSSIIASPNSVDTNAGSIAVTANLGALTCNTLYYYRVTAVNSSGTKSGSASGFRTAACPVNLALTLHDNHSSDTSTRVTPGASLTYLAQVSNSGPLTASNVVLKMPARTGLTVTDVTCTATDGALCPVNSTVTDLQGTTGLVIPTLPMGGHLTFTIPTTVASSNLTAYANLTVPYGTVDTNTANNASSHLIVVVKRPDLVVTSIVLNPTTPAANGTFSAVITVENQGSVAVRRFYIDLWTNQPDTQNCDAKGDAWINATMPTGVSTTTVTINNLQAGDAGIKTLRAFADSWCEIGEPNRANNQSTVEYTVQ